MFSIVGGTMVGLQAQLWWTVPSMSFHWANKASVLLQHFPPAVSMQISVKALNPAGIHSTKRCESVSRQVVRAFCYSVAGWEWRRRHGFPQRRPGERQERWGESSPLWVLFDFPIGCETEECHIISPYRVFKPPTSSGITHTSVGSTDLHWQKVLWTYAVVHLTFR